MRLQLNVLNFAQCSFWLNAMLISSLVLNIMFEHIFCLALVYSVRLSNGINRFSLSLSTFSFHVILIAATLSGGAVYLSIYLTDQDVKQVDFTDIQDKEYAFTCTLAAKWR